jgi:outer membrane receptor for ferric coprogen and ferric-rhodotorulic acid
LKALTISIALAFGAAPIQVSAQETPVQISIPAQSLSNALIQLGEQASLQIFYLPETVSGLNAPAVAGSLTPDQALRRLLVGTGIEVKRNGNTVSLSKPASGGTTQLAPIMVQGALSATTEDTNSYAAQAVTIGKGVQTLREIPQSVSVMTRQQMDDQGFTTVAEALNQVTGISLSNYERQENFLARGYVTGSQFDGVPQMLGSFKTLYDLALYDRIEVLRGPSGLLSGNGDPGGSVNFVRKRPTDSFHISGALTTGSWDNYRGELDVGGPLNETGTLRGRAVVATQEQKKFWEVGKDKNQTFYGIIEYDLTPRTTIGIAGILTRRDYVNNWGLPTFSDGSLPGRRAFVGSDDNSRVDQKEINLALEHRFDNGWNAKASYNHRESDSNYIIAYATTPIDINTNLANVSAGYLENEWKSDNFDINISGPISLFGKQHQLMFGYNQAELDNLAGTKYSAATGWDVLNNHNFEPILNRDISQKSQTVTKQSGFYGSARIKVLDPLTLVLGGRLSDYETKSRTVGATTTPWTTSTAKASGEFTPYGGLVWDVNKQVTLYTSYTDIFSPQSQLDYTGKALDPRIGSQIEIGAKGEFFDGRLNASIAAFRIRDKNRAMLDPDHTGCTGPTNGGMCWRGAGEVESQGWELELSGSPTPNWDISAGYTYVRAKYISDTNSANVGQRFGADLTPVHLFKLWSQYRFGPDTLDGALSGWTIGAGVRAQSDLENSTYTRQGGYAIVSAKVDYRINKKWKASLLVDNLFDRKYLAVPGLATFYTQYGEPRNFMLSLRGKF